jgi:hypothetical protein
MEVVASTVKLLHILSMLIIVVINAILIQVFVFLIIYQEMIATGNVFVNHHTLELIVKFLPVKTPVITMVDVLMLISVAAILDTMEIFVKMIVVVKVMDHVPQPLVYVIVILDISGLKIRNNV